MSDNDSTIQRFNSSSPQAMDGSTDTRPVDFSTASNTVIRVESLWKQYRLGVISHRTLRHDFESWWARVRGKDDPNQRLDSTIQPFNHSTRDAPSTGEAPDRFWALRDVSFDVKQGEVLGIIGRNGAGKSTLLKILSKVTRPTRGEIKISGRVASLLEVGTGFHPELTGRENIFLNGAILGMSKAEIRAKLDEIIAFAEIEKFIDTPVKRYSSGMYVRLAFAVAAHLEPEILIVDEVLAVGDLEFQKKCLGKMEEVGKEGRTVLFVSHNMASLKKLCTKANYFKSGTLINSGEVNAIVSQYVSECAGELSRRTRIPYNMHKVRSPLQIAEVQFINSRGDFVSAFEYGEQVEIRLLIDVSEAISEVRIGIGFVADGVRVATVHTPAINISMPAKSLSIICRIPCEVFLPNHYLVQLGAHSAKTGRGLDWIPDAAAFQVLDVATAGTVSIDEKELGFIRLNPAWIWDEKSVSRRGDGQ